MLHPTTTYSRRRTPRRGTKRIVFGVLTFLAYTCSRRMPQKERRLGALSDVVRGPMRMLNGFQPVFGQSLEQSGKFMAEVARTVKEITPKKSFRDRCRQVRSVEHMNRLLDRHPLKQLSVKGDGTAASSIRSHPVATILRQRVEKGYKPGQKDGKKVALAIEGGGMRGAVSAGMAHALSVLGLNDAIDCVYGSSAGSIVGAYFVSRQWRATGIYRDLLPCAKDKFLDIKHLVPALFPAQSLQSRKDLEHPLGSNQYGGLGEVFNLTFLLEDVMGQDGHYPLDWDTFVRNNEHQPLNVVAAAPLTRRSVRLTQKGGHFKSLRELFACMRASMCVPGLAGPPQYLEPHQAGDDGPESLSPSRGEAQALHRLGEDWGAMSGRCEPLVDALLYEPIPYRQAVEDGATHVLVLRTRPEDAEVLGEAGAGGIWEHHICDNYFRRYGLHGAASFMKQLGDKRIYAEDVLTFNMASEGRKVQTPPPFGRRRKGRGGATAADDTGGEANAYVMNMVPPQGCTLAEMEMDREKILEGLRSGFEAVVDALASEEQLAKLGSGRQAAKEHFPESALVSEYNFTTMAREALLEAGVQIYKETDRNSRVLKALDATKDLATMPLRLPHRLYTKIRDKRRERRLRKELRLRRQMRQQPRAQARAVPVPVRPQSLDVE